MIVVSDASPLISLSAVGHLDLLRLLYQEVVVPETVRQEVLRAGPGRPGAKDLEAADWIVAHTVEHSHLVRALDGDVDRGEAEAIALAVELGADVLLIDERRGRAVARRFGLHLVGVLGVLIEAKARGFLPALKPVLDDLLVKAGFRVSTSLYEDVLLEGGELPPARK